jgi:hypothetical protein
LINNPRNSKLRFEKKHGLKIAMYLRIQGILKKLEPVSYNKT